RSGRRPVRPSSRSRRRPAGPRCACPYVPHYEPRRHSHPARPILIARRSAAGPASRRGGRRAEVDRGGDVDRVAASSSELDAIRRGADRILAGASPASVAAQWSRLGLPSRSGRAGWTSRDVRRVLTHPRNLDRGTLSAETLCRLLAILEDPAGTPPTAGGLLSGVLECGTCGALCGSGGPDVYSCPDGHAAVDRAPADQFVDSVVRSHLPPARHTGFGRHPKQIRKDLDAMRAAIDRTARAFAARRLSPAHAAQVSKALVGSIDDLRAEL